MKMHIGVNASSGLTHTAIGTAANTDDVVIFEKIQSGPFQMSHFRIDPRLLGMIEMKTRGGPSGRGGTQTPSNGRI